MSFLNKLKTRTDELKQAAHEAMLKNLAPEYLKQARTDICLSCEHLFQPTKTCMKCGCFVELKSRIINAKCPIDKW